MAKELQEVWDYMADEYPQVDEYKIPGAEAAR